MAIQYAKVLLLFHEKFQNSTRNDILIWWIWKIIHYYVNVKYHAHKYSAIIHSNFQYKDLGST